MVSSAPPASQELPPYDPRNTTAYQLVLRTVVGLLMAKGSITWKTIRDAILLAPAIVAVFKDLSKTGVMDDYRETDHGSNLYCTASIDDLITAWYRLDAHAAKQRGADQ